MTLKEGKNPRSKKLSSNAGEKQASVKEANRHSEHRSHGELPGFSSNISGMMGGGRKTH